MLNHLGFQKKPYDLCSFRRVRGTDECTILTYVDDLFIQSTEIKTLNEVSSTGRKKH